MGLAGGLSTNGGLSASVAEVSTQLGLSSGSDDTAVINAALSAGGRVRGLPGQTYQISSPLIIPSNTEIDMTGCTVSLIASSNKNMLNNTQVAPTITLTDGAMTNGSAVLTSASGKFTAGMVGQPIGVVAGSNSNGQMLYTTVASYQSATQVTLSANCTNTSNLTNGTVYIYSASRDTNIVVRGGTWNAGNIDSATSFNRNIMRFRRMDNLRIEDVNITNTGATQAGGRYSIAIGDVTQFTVQNPNFNTVSDGVHIQGPASVGRILNVQGTTGDDMVAFTCVDSVTMTDVEGDIHDIVVDGVLPTNCAEALKITSGLGAGNTQRTVRALHAKNITGTINGTGTVAMVSIIDYTGATNVECNIENVASPSVPSGCALVYIACAQGKTIKLRNLSWTNAATAPTNGLVQCNNATIQNLEIENLYQAGNPSGNSLGVFFTNTCNITRLAVHGYFVADNPANLYGVWLNASATTVGTLSLKRVYAVGQFGRIINNPGPATLTEVIAEDVNLSAAVALYNGATGAGNTRIRLTNGTVTAAYLVATNHPVEVDLTACTFTISGAMIQANNAAATPIRVRMGTSVKQTGAGALLSRSASQALSVNGTGISVDQSLLTPSTGDVITNSVATGTVPAAQVIYDGTIWRSLQTPASLASGTATLTAGSSGAISNTAITANSKIRTNRMTSGGTLGNLAVTLSAGASFTITSSSGTDTSTVFWEIVQY